MQVQALHLWGPEEEHILKK